MFYELNNSASRYFFFPLHKLYSVYWCVLDEQLDSIIRTKVELGAKIHHIAENLVESQVHYVVKKGALDALENHKHSVSQLHLRKDLAQHADDLHMKLREYVSQ